MLPEAFERRTIEALLAAQGELHDHSPGTAGAWRAAINLAVELGSRHRALRRFITCCHRRYRVARDLPETVSAAAAPLFRLGLGPMPVDEIAWILFRRAWVEPRLQAFCNGDRTAVFRVHVAHEVKEAELARGPVP